MIIKWHDMLQVIKRPCQRVGFLYLVLFVAFFFFMDHKAILRMGKLKALSRAMPVMDYGREVSGRFKEPSRKALVDCRYYHRLVATTVSSSVGEAWGVAAFCAYGLGREAEAIHALESSLKTTPVFFWTQYNLGVAKVNQGDYRGAGDAFLKAVRLNPQYTLMILSSSKIYKDIFYSMHEPYDPEAGLREGYREANVFLQMAMTCFRNPQAPSCQGRGRLRMKMF